MQPVTRPNRWNIWGKTKR